MKASTLKTITLAGWIIGLGVCLPFGVCLPCNAQETAPQTEDQSVDEVLGLKEISELQIDIHKEVGKTPPDRFMATRQDEHVRRDLSANVFEWESPNIEYQPLFFEDVPLERYGQSVSWLQPGISGVHFFNRVLTLPLHAAVESPFSRNYPLGYFRPGNRNPYLHYQLPW